MKIKYKSILALYVILLPPSVSFLPSMVSKGSIVEPEKLVSLTSTYYSSVNSHVSNNSPEHILIIEVVSPAPEHSLSLLHVRAWEPIRVPYVVVTIVNLLK